MTTSTFPSGWNEERVKQVLAHYETQTPEEAIAEDGSEVDAIALQKAALAKLRAEMESIPDSAPNDGLGGADHDRILYGWNK